MCIQIPPHKPSENLVPGVETDNTATYAPWKESTFARRKPATVTEHFIDASNYHHVKVKYEHLPVVYPVARPKHVRLFQVIV